MTSVHGSNDGDVEEVEFAIRPHTFDYEALVVLENHNSELVMPLIATIESVDHVTLQVLSRLCIDKQSALEICNLFKTLDEGMVALGEEGRMEGEAK